MISMYGRKVLLVSIISSTVSFSEALLSDDSLHNERMFQQPSIQDVHYFMSFRLTITFFLLLAGDERVEAVLRIHLFYHSQRLLQQTT